MENYEQTTGTLLAGGVKRPITPTVRGRRVFLAGHDGGRLATDIHDELWVRALVLQFSEITLVLIALDLLGLLHDDIEYVRGRAIEAGLPASHVIVTCTYNHSGPDTIGLWSKGALGSGLNVRYLNFLREELVQVIELAILALEPAEVYLARSEVRDLVGNGESRELAVLQLRTPTGKRIATVVNFPLVPQALEETNTSISADFPNWLCEEFEASRDEVALYICADANERLDPTVRQRSLDEAERLGRRLAAAVREALDGISPTPIERLSVWQRPITIPTSDPVARWLRQVGVLRRHSLTEWRTSSQVGLIELGPARMAALPGLVAPELGFEIRKLLDAPFRFLLCMSNDNLGSILPQRPTSPRGVLDSSHVGTIVLDELADLMLEAREEERV